MVQDRRNRTDSQDRSGKGIWKKGQAKQAEGGKGLLTTGGVSGRKNSDHLTAQKKELTESKEMQQSRTKLRATKVFKTKKKGEICL